MGDIEVDDHRASCPFRDIAHDVDAGVCRRNLDELQARFPLLVAFLARSAASRHFRWFHHRPYIYSRAESRWPVSVRISLGGGYSTSALRYVWWALPNSGWNWSSSILYMVVVPALVITRREDQENRGQGSF
jgi:hypothetical protein